MFDAIAAALLVVSAGLAAPASPPDADDAMTSERLEQMLDREQDAFVVATFRRYPDELLPFIDAYLEGGLRMIEEGKGGPEPAKSFQLGMKFAELADQARPGSGFSAYAASFASWSPKEQKLFREGQAEHRAGSKATGEPARAAAHFEKSAEIAQSLNDDWGVAMALAGLAGARLAMGDFTGCEEAAARAVAASDRLGLRLDQVRTCIVWGDAQFQSEGRGWGIASYNRAWSLLNKADDIELRKAVLERYVDALERSSQMDAAERMREANPDLVQPAEPPKSN